jgi:hypothetical protein
MTALNLNVKGTRRKRATHELVASSDRYESYRKYKLRSLDNNKPSTVFNPFEDLKQVFQEEISRDILIRTFGKPSLMSGFKRLDQLDPIRKIVSTRFDRITNKFLKKNKN